MALRKAGRDPGDSLTAPRRTRILETILPDLRRRRHGAPGHPQRQTLEARRDGAQMDHRRPAGGSENLPSRQGLSARLPILRNALQEHLRKAQADSAIETIMKVA